MSLRAWIKILSAATVVSLFLVACQKPSQKPESDPNSDNNAQASPVESMVKSENCRTVRHEMGETEICGEPERIVVLGPYLLEQMLALGKQPFGYGEHVAIHQDDYDNPSQQIPYLGSRVTTQPVNVGLAYQPNVEAILKAQPDLILAPIFGQVDYAQLAKIAPTLSFDVMGGKSNLAAMGEAFGVSDRANKLLAKTKAQLEQAKAQFALIVKDNPKVLMLSAENTQSFSLITESNSRCGSLVKELGFQPVYPEGLTDKELSAVPQVSLESLTALEDVDSILLFGYNYEVKDDESFDRLQNNSLKPDWEKNAIAQSFNASQAGRVYFLPAYLCLGLPGPIGTELYLEKLKKQLIPTVSVSN